MDVDCNNMFDLCLGSETTATLFEYVGPEEHIFCANNSKMVDVNDAYERDIQDLFDGATNLQVDEDEDNEFPGSWDEGPSCREVKEITDQEIANLPVQELNKHLRNVPWEEAARIRKRRRNLKNRGYSLSCRLRKQREQEDLINENTSLRKELEDGKWKLLKMWKEKEAYKRKYLQLQKRNQEMKISGSLPSC